jgi:hypothetical protein
MGLSPPVRALSDRVRQLRCRSHSTGILALSTIGAQPRSNPLHAKAAMRQFPVLTAHTPTGENAAQCFHHELRRPPAEHCLHQAHSSVCTAVLIPSAAIPIDPLGSALVSLWVFQKTQHDARIVQEGKRKAMRPSFWERASMTRRGGSVIAAGCALI